MVTIKNLALFGSTLFASGVFGNIMFPQPQVHCSDHCPRGMSCGAEGMCVKPFHPSVVPENHHTRRRAVKGSTVRHMPLVPRQAYSTNGQCGAQNGNTICNPAATTYTGSCCSPAGWCGNSAAHCGTGCQSGCGATQPPPTGPGAPTQDGSCGSTNGGTTCAGWGTGECCSMYGWCGNSPGHCGAGCQNGPCTGGGGGGGNPGTGVPPGPAPAPAHPTPGAFNILPQRAGVPAMHAGLLPNGKVVFLDKVEDYTEVRLPNGRFAYSAEYDPSGTVAPVGLSYRTNAFCSGGTFLANGDFLAIGGNGPLTWLDDSVGDGFRGLRVLSRRYNDASLNGQSWKETIGSINSARWYPSAQTLADGRVFVASGSLNGLDPTVLANNNPTWELLNANGQSITGSTPMPLLVANQPYYMYPFMHLLNNGQLFVFTSRSSVLINPTNGAVQRTLPDLAGDYRTYPNTGGSVMLPLSAANNWNGKIMICGGGAYQDITSPTDPSCGLIDALAANPTWEYESMPQGRGMVEGVLLPDGSVVWLNGANKGAQGFLLAEDPTLSALLYTPTRPAGQRWQTLAASTIPRLYHSVALLLLDGTILVAGSSPNEMPVLTPRPGAPYITDFRVERYTPPYLTGANANRRPSISFIQVRTWSVSPTFTVKLNFSVPTGVTVTNDNIKIVLYHGGFVTHSVHMGHRMMNLSFTGYKAGNSQSVTVSMPPNRNVAPPGPYVLYVVVNGVPSVGQFVMIRND